MDSKKKIKIIALFGKAGSGKDSCQQQIMKVLPNEVHGIISETTRPKREGEQEGVAYHFVSEEQFKTQPHIETAEFRGWYYGTPYSSLDKNKINIGVFNIAGVKQILQNKDLEVVPIFIDCSDKERLMRQLMREDHPDCQEICRRFSTDEQDFSDIPFEYITIRNEYVDIAETCKEIARIVLRMAADPV